MQFRDFAGRFRDPHEIARGGMGCIEAAHDAVIGRHVAIKTLRAEFRDDERALHKFTQEARITGQLEHPNVVPVYDLGDGPEEPFIVMRLVKGSSLTQLLAQSPPPTTPAQAANLLRRFVQIVLRLCDALSFAHERSVFHCDVKPDNVMVGDYGQVYLMDWGVAIAEQPRDAFGGTAAYMAPEQLLGRTEEIDERTDVFGLGGIICEILTGAPPNEGRSVVEAARAQLARALSPRRLWTQLPPELCRITLKALAPVRENRYATVAELRDDLEQFLKGGGWFDTLNVADGETIVSEGEPGATAYIIENGTCDVWKTIQGERRLIRRLGPGDVFGEAAVFTGGSRTASIVAAGDVTLKVITGEALNRELDQNPILAAFVRSLAALFRDTDAALSARGVTLSDLPPNSPAR